MTSAYLAALFFSTSQLNHLPDGLLSAVCYVESGHNVNAVHIADGSGDSLGVCQVQLASARLLGFKGSARELRSPSINVYWSARILVYQHNRYHRDILKTIGAYNAGSWRTVEGKPINEGYIKAVLKAWKEDR